MSETSPTNVIGISVVVPSFNQGRFIDETIRSLLDQNYPNLEILVMDGGSTDDTIERLKVYGDRIRWISEKDEGQSDAIVKGFARTSKPWITWLNSDDVQCNRALWRLNEAVAANPNAEVVIGGGHYMDADGSNERPYPTINVGPGIDVKREMFEKGYVAQPSVFYTRELYNRVGGLDRSLHFCMDYELWTRFAVSGATFARIDADISGNRWYETTKTSAQTFDLYAEILATQQRVFGIISPYYVQAVSDHLYTKFHAQFYGEYGYIFIRWVYFKALWVALNARAPLYCIKGLFRYTLSKSGATAGDFMTLKDWYRGFKSFVRPWVTLRWGPR
ncbi:glycosyltransferase family 2 protein [Microvirga flavescens]|uniref:glycosyltransferase family 2 protein n=1 Tax=Microvirga flavescens TaxID=2249811 RepID=UPI001300345E|nr:glycosyltransferase family 2 protein [Microvirga flavescens]